MAPMLQQYLRNETAATSIEYALIAGTLSIVIVVTVNTVGTSLNTLFTTLAAALK